VKPLKNMQGGTFTPWGDLTQTLHFETHPDDFYFKHYAVDSDGDGVGDQVDAFPTDPTETVDSDRDGIGNNADLDDDNDGLSDVGEAGAGTDPLNPDTDGDGLPDGRDVEFVETAISALPLSTLRPPGGGTQKALLATLDAIELLLAQARTVEAITLLQTLRARVDGCGTTAANDDWIRDCAAQVQIRALIDTLLANLSA
jgi:hypothetical protein